jgi:hypothetical protein
LHGVSSRNEAVPYRLRDQHQAAGNVSSGKDMGLRGPQILINLDESPMIGLDAGCSEAQPSSIGRPPYRHKCQCRLSAALDAVPGEDHSHPRWCFFECLDDTDILVDRDVRAAESRRNCCGYILILTRQDARPCLEELDARAKGVEDRGDLHPCCSSANDQHRWRDGGQTPCVAMVIRQFRAAHWELPAYAASANDDLFSLKPQTAFGFYGVLVGEARNAGVLVDGHSQRIDLRAQGRMRSHIVDDLAYARKQPGIIQHGLAHAYAVLT